MANVKREHVLRLLAVGIKKGRFIDKVPRNSYFERQTDGSYIKLPYKTIEELYIYKGWKVPKEVMKDNRENMDKGGRPKKLD